MNEKALWYLEGIDLFGRFCPVKSKESEGEHPVKVFDAGEVVYTENEPSKSLYIIEQGRVRIAETRPDGSEITKSILREGEVFGEMVLAGQSIHRDYAQAMEKGTRICLLEWSTIEGLMRDNADLSIRIVKWMGFKIQKLERRVESLTFKDARTRIVEFLKDAAAFKGKQVGEEWMIRTKLTHSDIASLTATSRQTVSEVLNDMRREDQIYFERGKILIRDIDQLK